MLSLLLIFIALVAVTVTVSIYKDTQSKKPASSRANFTWSYVFIASVFFFVCRALTIAIPLLVLSLWMAIRANRLNIAGIKFWLKTLPYTAFQNHPKVIEICDEALLGDTRAPNLYAIGYRSALELHEYKKCLEYCNRLILLLQEEPDAYLLRSKAHANLKNFEQSLSDLNKAISLDPISADVYKFERARSKYFLKDFESALADISEFSTSPYCNNSNKYLADALKAQCLFKLNKQQEALSLIENAISLGTRTPIDTYYHFIAIQAEILVFTGEWNRLIEVASKTLEQCSLDNLLIYRALAYAATNNFELAERDLITQENLPDPSADWKPVALAVKAYIAVKTNKLDDAVEQSKQAVELNDSLELPRLVQAYSLIENEKFDQAQEAINQMLKDFPKLGDVYQLQSLINENSGEEKRKLDNMKLALTFGHSKLFL